MSAPPFNQPTDEPKITEKALRKLLLSRKPEDAARLDQCRRTAKPEEITRSHQAVAEDTASTASVFSRLTPLLWGVNSIIHLVGDRDRAMAWIWATMLALVVGVMAAEPFLVAYRRRAARIAAEWLIRQHERKALTPMAALWRPVLTEKATARNVAFQETLSALIGQPGNEEGDALRKMIERALPFSFRFSKRDFSDSAADVLLAALGLLAKAPMTNGSILRRVAQFPAPASCRNRVLLRDVAILFVEKPKIAVPLQRPATAQSAASLATVAPTTTEAQNVVQQRRG